MIKSYYTFKEFSEKLYTSKSFNLYFNDLRIGILDIETTGLNPESCFFVLGGIISYESNSLEQFFVEDPAKEKEILEIYLKKLSSFDVIITYNGHSFDIPFIIKRASKLGITIDFNLPYNLDLYILLNRYSELRKFLPNLKQKTIENFMGLWSERKDEISGKESVYLYYEYIKSKNTFLKNTILLHNADDLCQLSRLLPIIEKIDFHKAMYSMGFLIKRSVVIGDWINVNKIAYDNKSLIVCGKQGDFPFDFTSYGHENMLYFAKFNKSTNDFNLNIPVEKYEKHFFIDIRNSLKDYKILEKYPSVENDFLIFKKDNSINYLELNHFLILFLKSIEVKQL